MKLNRTWLALPADSPARAASEAASSHAAAVCVTLGECATVTALPGDSMAEFAEGLAAALDLREHGTGLHSKRVACRTLVLARRFCTDPSHLRQVYWGSLLHDLGKIGVPDAILLKPGPLSPEEWAVMREHPANGYRILAAMPGMEEAAAIVLCHEERYDGSGYPRGLRGDAIPLAARLFAVVDTLDAMIADRPYRKALEFTSAKTEILSQRGRQFDAIAVDAFLAEEPALRAMSSAGCAAAGQSSTRPGPHPACE